MKSKKTKPLKLHLFLIPSLVIFLSLGLTILVFHILIQQYIEKITRKEIDTEFNFFDLYYNAGDPDAVPDLNLSDESMGEAYQSDLIISVHNVVLDENYEAVIPGEPYIYTEEEIRKAKIISDYFKKHSSEMQDSRAFLIKDGNESYYLRYKQYYGISDGGFTIVMDRSDLAQNYTLVVYANISSMLDFTGILYRILLALMMAFGLISILVIVRLNKKIDFSFNKLKEYIKAVGKREFGPDFQEPELEYLEFRDVSDTVKEMLLMIEKAEESQKQFFQNASHELRTPLMSIQGYAEGIASGVMKNNEKSAGIIIKESQKMSSLVDEILFLSRMDMNASKKQFEEIDIKELLYSCSWSIKGMADQQGLQIVHEFTDERITVIGEETQLEKAFTNVLSNAVRYAESQIRIHCEQNQNQVIVSVTDDGAGISKEDLPRIFERFYKGEKGHFGIGLAITEKIVTQHGGEIEAFSKERATEFRFTLPCS